MVERATSNVKGTFAKAAVSTLDAGPLEILPTASQLIVLRAILCPASEFESCWKELRETVASGGLDSLSANLLPLLHRRLSSLLTDELSANVRLRHRRNWAANQLLFHTLAETLRTLHNAGIRTLVLKGAALALRYYEDVGCRVMGDFDVLVPQGELLASANLLLQHGWRSWTPLSSFDPRFSHAITFEDSRGNVLDLHAHVLHFSSQKDADELFWKQSASLTVQGSETRTLGGADFVLHLAVHGMRWGAPPNPRWVADIAQILSCEEIDWDRLLFLSQHLHTSVAVRKALGFLAAQQFTKVPERVMTELERRSVGRRERRSFELYSRDISGNLRMIAQHHWYVMTHHASEAGLLKKLRLTPGYVAHRRKVRGSASWWGMLGDSVARNFTRKS